MALGLAIGAITFSGSLVAFGKLQGIVRGSPLVFRGQHLLNALLLVGTAALIVFLVREQSDILLWALAIIAILFGFLLILPIGGADMPCHPVDAEFLFRVAACGIGFTLNNYLLIITVSVGASGAILSYIMCKGMNRSIIKVILGGFGGAAAPGATGPKGPDKPIKTGSAEDAAFIMKNARLVIIVPGYGMAVAQAQHILGKWSSTD